MKIKGYKIMLLGIAIILLGIYATPWVISRQVIMVRYSRIEEIRETLAAYAPYIGIAIVIIGAFIKDNIDENKEDDEDDI